jgi:hypothetical protein
MRIGSVWHASVPQGIEETGGEVDHRTTRFDFLQGDARRQSLILCNGLARLVSLAKKS